MANLTSFRDTSRLGDQAFANYAPSFGVAASTTIYGGSLVFVDTSDGYAYASTGATRVCVGYNDGPDIDNSAGSAGAKTIIPRRAPISLTNSGASALANADRGALVYAEDNQTARKVNTGSAYAPLGSFIGISQDGSSVVVEAGVGVGPILSLASYQPLDADLTAIAALDATAGMLAKTAANTYARRTLTAPAAGFTITNPAGTAGDPTFVLANDLAALEGLSTTGLVTRTGDGTATTRTIVAGNASLSVTNGDGVSGNPSIDNLHACLELADPGDGVAIPVTRSATCMFTVGAGVETNTLAIPTFVGQTMRLTVGSIAGGTRAVTAASAINAAGNTIMTFNAARDNCDLRAVKVGGTLAWEIGFNASVSLS